MVVAVSFRQVEEYRVVRSSLGMKNITMFLRENICSQYSDSFIILCNSHFNRQRQLIDLLNQHQIKYIYLPPLSAALNPAQTIFKLL